MHDKDRYRLTKEDEVKYDAFISYRHMPLDMEMAKKLHKGLETFPVPAAVRESSGKKKIERVFRDQEELPIGSNLTEEISAALAESEYLIVVCSHFTPESTWVQREIETFVSMHDRSHVLAILIEGEPEESFPKQLLIDDDGNTVEPLAADVRGETRQERNRKFNTELLRLAAPILGCSYDDLKQRHRERFIRRMVIEISALAGVVALAGALFGVYNARVADDMKKLADEKAQLATQMGELAEEKTQLANEIMEEYQDKLKNQSRFYAETSLSLLTKGKREAAVMVAAEAIPAEGNERPYVPEAEYALANALRVYDYPTTIASDRNLHHDFIVRDLKLSSDGKRLITEDSSHNLHVWTVDGWKEDMYVAHTLQDNDYYTNIVNEDADEDSIYLATTESLYRYDNQGNIVWKEDMPDIVRYADFSPENNEAFVVFPKYIQRYDTRNGILIDTYDKEVDDEFSKKTCLNADAGVYVCIHADGVDHNTYISFININDKSVTGVQFPGKSIFKMGLTKDGNIAVFGCEKDFLLEGDAGRLYLELYSPAGELIWSKDSDIKIKSLGLFRTFLSSGRYDDGSGTKESVIMFGIEDKLFVYKEDGSIVNGFLFDKDIYVFMSDDSSRLVHVGYDDGRIVPIDPITGIEYTGDAIDTGEAINDAVQVHENIVFRSMFSADVTIVGYPDRERVNELTPLDDSVRDQYCVGWNDKGAYYSMGDMTGVETFCYLDRNGDSIYTFDPGLFVCDSAYYEDKHLIFSKDEMILVDPVAGRSESFKFKDMGIDKSGISTGTISDKASYLTVYSVNKAYVIDVATHSVVFQYEADENIRRAVTTDDLKRLYISQVGTDLYYVDIATGERIDIEGERLRQVSNLSSKPFLILSPDGRFTAMCCLDDKIRIIENNSDRVIEELPFGATERLFMRFSLDGEYLITQGDDYKVRIWSLEKNQWVSSFDISYTIRNVWYSADGKYLALLDINGIYLLETESYKRIANIPVAMVYIPEENGFIQRKNGKQFYTTYMNVSELYEEYKRQFPDSSLSDEEKETYNID